MNTTLFNRYKTKILGIFSVALLTLLFIGIALPTGLVSAKSGGTVSPLIVGGHAATERYPGMASLQIEVPGDPNYHICGAILVSHLYAVTNAHCVTDYYGDGADGELFNLRIGSSNRLKGGETAGVTEVLPHADWDWGTGYDAVADIAMLRLDTYVQLQPFEVAPYLSTKNAATTRLLGWGVTEPSGEGPLPTKLQELDTKVVSPEKCEDSWITEGEICVANVNDTDGACYGDSGGPALQKVTSKRWSVVGGTSRSATDCGTGTVVYTDHTFFRKWMYEVMRTGSVPESTLKVHSKKLVKANYNKWNRTFNQTQR